MQLYLLFPLLFATLCNCDLLFHGAWYNNCDDARNEIYRCNWVSDDTGQYEATDCKRIFNQTSKDGSVLYTLGTIIADETTETLYFRMSVQNVNTFVKSLIYSMKFDGSDLKCIFTGYTGYINSLALNKSEGKGADSLYVAVGSGNVISKCDPANCAATNRTVLRSNELIASFSQIIINGSTLYITGRKKDGDIYQGWPGIIVSSSRVSEGRYTPLIEHGRHNASGNFAIDFESKNLTTYYFPMLTNLFPKQKLAISPLNSDKVRYLSLPSTYSYGTELFMSKYIVYFSQAVLDYRQFGMNLLVTDTKVNQTYVARTWNCTGCTCGASTSIVIEEVDTPTCCIYQQKFPQKFPPIVNPFCVPPNTKCPIIQGFYQKNKFAVSKCSDCKLPQNF
eukprot:m.338051 g.338051  ORF g.338051 m.338051 type:complete len:393 (-) comp18300_c0_seq1:34-1212(-)